MLTAPALADHVSPGVVQVFREIARDARTPRGLALQLTLCDVGARSQPASMERAWAVC